MTCFGMTWLDVAFFSGLPALWGVLIGVCITLVVDQWRLSRLAQGRARMTALAPRVRRWQRKVTGSPSASAPSRHPPQAT